MGSGSDIVRGRRADLSRLPARRAQPPAAVALLLAVVGLPAAASGFDVPALPWAPRAYVCPRAAEAPAIDGRLDEPSWRRAPETALFTDITGARGAAPPRETRARLLWDDEALYVGAELAEPHLWATYVERDAVIYHENDFEVFIDPDGDHHHYAELEINARNTVWDLLLVKPYRDGGPALDGWDLRGLRTAVHLDGTLNDPGDMDRGWSVEIAIPWAALEDCRGAASCPPAPGDAWRVNFSRVQWELGVEAGAYVKVRGPDGRPLPEANWVWSPQGLVAMHVPERWGFVIFSDRTAGADLPRAEIPQDLVPGARYLMPLYYAQQAYRQEHGTYATAFEQLAIPLGAAPYLERKLAALDLVLNATAWQYEARLATRGRTWHVDHTGRLWATD